MPGRMVGTVWGIERIHRADGEERRHRRRCRYFCEGDCRRYARACCGSAHCDGYVARAENNGAASPEVAPRKPFQGIEEIDVADVVVPPHRFLTPSTEKIMALRDYYLENGELDKPIIVSCKDGQYVLEDKYLRYYLAKEVGMTGIYARCGEKGCDKAEEPFRKVGTRVKTPKGTGTVVAVGPKYVTVSLGEDKTAKYDIARAVASNTLVLAERS